ncbi:hypothetical protein NGRA_3102 [Nosema granulosis]|uniref:Uncharacterized protein n=1 Tax=Nosema granulosis TaxID=83296 RepID=A0A9P6KY02_9MICR|nr:hypothetical protein NGRA_3102 [Nosema granulosis]
MIPIILVYGSAFTLIGTYLYYTKMEREDQAENFVVYENLETSSDSEVYENRKISSESEVYENRKISSESEKDENYWIEEFLKINRLAIDKGMQSYKDVDHMDNEIWINMSKIGVFKIKIDENDVPMLNKGCDFYGKTKLTSIEKIYGLFGVMFLVSEIQKDKEFYKMLKALYESIFKAYEFYCDAFMPIKRAKKPKTYLQQASHYFLKTFFPDYLFPENKKRREHLPKALKHFDEFLTNISSDYYTFILYFADCEYSKDEGDWLVLKEKKYAKKEFSAPMDLPKAFYGALTKLREKEGKLLEDCNKKLEEAFYDPSRIIFEDCELSETSKANLFNVLQKQFEILLGLSFCFYLL